MANKLARFNSFISNKPSAQLAVIAGLGGLIYWVVFTLPFPLAGLYRTIPPVDYTKLTHYSPAGLAAYVIGIGTLFGLYFQAIRLVAPGREHTSAQATMPPISPLFIFLVSAALAAISIFAYPLTAIDLFIYAIRTRGWALYGLNPLVTAPELLPRADPWLGLAGEWVGAPSPYGPLWEWLSLGAFYLAGGGFLEHLFALKILAALAYLGCVWLVFKSLDKVWPRWAIAGTMAFAWNPLVLLESVQNGHNDIVMAFFLLAAIWVFAKWSTNHRPPNRPGLNPLFLLICLLLALSILVKFVTAIVIPFFLIGMARPQPKWSYRLVSVLLYGFIIAGLVVLVMSPLWPGRDNWAVLRAGSNAGRSLLALLVLALRGRLGLNSAFDLSRNLILSIFGLIYLYHLWQALANLQSPISKGHDVSKPQSSTPTLHSPTPTPQSPNLPISLSFHTLFWYVLLVAPVFHAWYLLWFLPLAALLLPHRRPVTAAIVFSMTALLIIPYFETIRVWYPLLLRNQLLGHLIGVPLLIGPPAVALLWPISRGEHSEV